MIKLSGSEMINSAYIRKIEAEYVQYCKPQESVSIYIVIKLTMMKGPVITIRNLLNDKIMLTSLKNSRSFESTTNGTGIWLCERYHDELETTLYAETMSSGLVPKIKEMILGLFNTYMVSTGGHTDSDKMTFEEYLKFLHSSGMSTEYQEFYKTARELYNLVYETLEATMQKLALRRLQVVHGGKLEDIEEELNRDDKFDPTFDMTPSEYEAKLWRDKYINDINHASAQNNHTVTTDATNEHKEEKKLYVVFNVFDFKNGDGNNGVNLESFLTYGYNVCTVDKNGDVNVVGRVERTVYSGLWFKIFGSKDARIKCDMFYYGIINNPTQFELEGSVEIKQLLKTLYTQFVSEVSSLSFGLYCGGDSESVGKQKLRTLLDSQAQSVQKMFDKMLNQCGAEGGKND